MLSSIFETFCPASSATEKCFFFFYFFRQGERPKALLVSGDLAHFSKQIESFGTKILIEPGNHNIADGWARKFIGKQNYKTRQPTATEFLWLLSPLNTVYF